jgi:hypothetical protein
VRQPEALAKHVFGGKRGERLGNVPGTDDAWLYRSRGLAYVTGRDDYQKVAQREGIEDFMNHPEWLLIPDINARSFIDNYFTAQTVPAVASLIGNKDWRGARVRVQSNAFGGSLTDKEMASADQTLDEIEKKTGTFDGCIVHPDDAETKAAAR